MLDLRRIWIESERKWLCFADCRRGLSCKRYCFPLSLPTRPWMMFPSLSDIEDMTRLQWEWFMIVASGVEDRIAWNRVEWCESLWHSSRWRPAMDGVYMQEQDNIFVSRWEERRTNVVFLPHPCAGLVCCCCFCSSCGDCQKKRPTSPLTYLRSLLIDLDTDLMNGLSW